RAGPPPAGLRRPGAPGPAGRQQAPRDQQADPAGAAGDDGGLAGEIEQVHDREPSMWPWPGCRGGTVPMIKELSGLPDGVIGFETTGKLRAEDYRDVVLPALER